MIHRDVEIIDLAPLTWRNMGAILPIDELAGRHSGSERVLSVLHQGGVVLNVVAPPGMTLPDVGRIDNPKATAQQLYESLPGLERVQIFDKDRLAAYSDSVQRLDWQRLSSGDFYWNAWQLAESDPVGLCYYPAEQAPWRRYPLAAARQLVAETPDGETLVLGVYDGGRPWFTLIAQVNAGLITLLTTFERLQPYGLDPMVSPASAEDANWVLPLITQHIGPVHRALFCTRGTFEAWLHVPNGERRHVLAGAPDVFVIYHRAGTGEDHAGR